MANEAKHYMREALKMAKRAADRGEAPIGAVIVREGKIIARGWNSREQEQQITGHAEMMALRKAARRLGSWRLEDCDLYVTLEPCLMCAGAIQQSRIRKVYFAASDPKGGSIHSLAQVWDLAGLNHYVQYEGGLLEEEASSALKQFFAALRQKKKEKKNQRRNT